MAKKKIVKKKSCCNLSTGKIFAILFALFGLAFFGYTIALHSEPKVQGTSTSKGFDQFGYNRTARIFNGSADGIDKVLDGKVWGDAKYANDKLTMKWNAEWDRGNAENWSQPPYDAWENNEWNGAFPGGSGEVWHYKIQWVGSCTESKLLADGGYCIWGQFEVLMDQGTYKDSGAMHVWYTHAKPTGYGAYIQ